jgi:hypothetical protein
MMMMMMIMIIIIISGFGNLEEHVTLLTFRGLYQYFVSSNTEYCNSITSIETLKFFSKKIYSMK